MKRFLPAAILIFLFCVPFFAQEGESAETIFYDADFWYTEEDYAEAAYWFKQVLRQEPENANVKFLLGMCYNNIRGEELKAIPLLQEATENITLKYKPGRFSVKKAPHHSWFYLADAYRRTNQLDKALDALDTFSSLKNFEKHYNLRITEDATTQVERAKIIKDAELNLRALYFNEPINTTDEDYSGVISANGKMMVWARHTTFYEAVFMSTREEMEWTMPVEINTQIVSDGYLFPTGLSADGTTMLLEKRPLRGDSDIWYAQYDGMFWSPAQPVHGLINSSSEEVHASFSPDGNRIYFASDRRGGEGGLDIWYSDKRGDGQWGEPVNMGDVINTGEDETSGFIAPGEGRFIFASKGHFNMGGYDIFRSELNSDGSWSIPANMGFPINTTSDDTYYVPLNEGLNGLQSRFTNEAIGGTDLWYVEIQGAEGFVEGGGLTLAIDTRVGLSSKDFAIILLDEETGEEIEVVYDSKNDAFRALSNQERNFKVISYKQ